MRGFLVGSLALIVLYAVIESADNAGAALSGSADLFARILSPKVAAVPNFAARKAADQDEDQVPKGAPVNTTVAPFVQRGMAPVRQPGTTVT